MPIPHGELSLLKIKYDSNMPQLPTNLTGKTFECLFGANQSMLELFILKRKIKGPCWLTIKGIKLADVRRTWCKHEVIIQSPKQVEVKIEDLNKDSPPLTGLCLSLKTSRSSSNQ